MENQPGAFLRGLRVGRTWRSESQMTIALNKRFLRKHSALSLGTSSSWPNPFIFAASSGISIAGRSAHGCNWFASYRTCGTQTPDPRALSTC